MAKFYNIQNMLNTVADYKYLMGGRNIGKSYQVKLTLLKKAFDTGSEFIYLRRYKEDMKNQLVTDYFADMNIAEITNGVYSEIYTYQGNIYFINRDEAGKPTDKKLIGRAHCLSTAEHQKSIMYPKVNDVIFEEFIPEKGVYLQNEPSKLLSYISTIARTRKIVVWLIGNTISKLSPYFDAWGLNRTHKQKLGTIDVYRRNFSVMTEEGILEDYVLIAIERCKGEGLLSRMSFGTDAKMIANNEWVTESKPLITKDCVDECKKIYTVYVLWQNLNFKCQFLKKDKDYFWYICPANSRIKLEELNNERVICDKVTFCNKHTNKLKSLSPREQKIFDYMLRGKIFYSDDITGTDFSNVLVSIR